MWDPISPTFLVVQWLGKISPFLPLQVFGGRAKLTRNR
jgi:hypothetical protein